MRENFTNNSKKPIVNFSSLPDLLSDLFSVVADGKNNKKKPLKLLSEHRNSLAELPMNSRLSINERNALSKKVLDTDSELKVLLALVVASANCRHLEVRKEVLSFACEVISNITFLNPLNNSNIFLLGDISSTNSGYLPHLILQLRNSFEHFKGETYKPAQKKTLEANILAIAHIWTFETGKSDIEITLNSFNKLLADSLKPVDSKKAVSIDGDGHAKTSMVYFLASITSSSLLKDFSATLSYFKARQEAAKSASISARREVGDLAEKNKKLENKIKNHKSEVQERDALIEDLKQQLTALTEQSSESELSLKAQKVHLKDDTSKAKAKALNFLEEELLSTLQSSLKALDRETPKVHIAVHNIDVMIERVEEELEWFKK